MHRKGWKLVKVAFPGLYTFEACDPEDVVYPLDYNQEGIAHKAEYTQMFADCLWEFLFDFFGYSYFRKPAAQIDGDESIFCDADPRMALIKRVVKGRLLPLLILFPTLLIGFFLVLRHAQDGFSFVIPGIYTLLLAMYVTIFCSVGLSFTV